MDHSFYLHGRLCDRFLRNRGAQRFTEISDGWVSESKVWSLTIVFVLNLDTAVEFLFADRFMTACAILGGKEGRSFADGNNSLNKCRSQPGGFALRPFCLVYGLRIRSDLSLQQSSDTEVKNDALHEA